MEFFKKWIKFSQTKINTPIFWLFVGTSARMVYAEAEEKKRTAIKLVYVISSAAVVIGVERRIHKKKTRWKQPGKIYIQRVCFLRQIFATVFSNNRRGGGEKKAENIYIPSYAHIPQSKIHIKRTFYDRGLYFFRFCSLSLSVSIFCR